VKHMDIKPKNILIREVETPVPARLDIFKVYLADFGIARSYNSAQESETDTPISFTRTYAAPEVVSQPTRGFSADMFSLGCVFTEMLATILSKPKSNLRDELHSIRLNEYGETSYQANLTEIIVWFAKIDKSEFLHDLRYAHLRKANALLLEKIPCLLDPVALLRPTSDFMECCTEPFRCLKCASGEEPLAAS
jgi:serine/threonine protein kinase